MTATTGTHPSSASSHDAFLADVKRTLLDHLRPGPSPDADSHRTRERSAVFTASTLEALIERLIDAGGKLFRPRLVLLGYLIGVDARAGQRHQPAETCAVCSNSPWPRELTDLAAAFEFLHLFGLLQDDVMDASLTRRGQSTAHSYVDELMSQPSWHKDPLPAGQPGLGSPGPGVGNHIATLAGDLAFALASKLVRGLPDAVTHVWDTTVLELVHGQRLDLLFAAEGGFDEADTFAVADAKSGNYTVLRPLQTGLTLCASSTSVSDGSTPPHSASHRTAAGNREVLDWLTEYGHALGRAFSIADDLIGFWGDPNVTGKPAGEDLRERKPSTVMGIALTMQPQTMHPFLAGDHGVRPHDVDALLTQLEDAGVRHEATTRAIRYRDEAVRVAQNVRCPVLLADLVGLADSIAIREA